MGLAHGVCHQIWFRSNRIYVLFSNQTRRMKPLEMEIRASTLIDFFNLDWNKKTLQMLTMALTRDDFRSPTTYQG